MAQGTGSVWEMTPHELGQAGERASARYLEGRGFEVVERNWRCEAGEVDLVVRDDDGTLVLVEVKTRLAPEGTTTWPELAVGEEKLSRYRRLARVYLASHPLEEELRFDVVGVSVVGESHAHVRHLSNVWLGDA